MKQLPKDDIELIFVVLKERRHLLLSQGNGSIGDYITFFEGFFFSLRMCYDVDLERAISAWFQDRVTQKAPNMYWFAQFEYCYCEQEEETRTMLLLDTLEAFFVSYFDVKE